MTVVKVFFKHISNIDIEKLLESSYIFDADYNNLTRLKNEEVQKEKAISTYFKNKYVGGYYLNEYGKPLSNNCFFNVSHSRGMVVFVKDNIPVGIDIEEVRKIDNEFKKYVCSSNEIGYVNSNKVFFELWTNKESLVKCLGTGIRNRVNEIPGLPFDDVRKWGNNAFRSKTVCLGDYIVSITRQSEEEFEVQFIEERDI